MRPQSLQEFAKDMWRKGDIRDADLADEILALIDIETEVAEPYSNLLADLEMHVPAEVGVTTGIEWLGDRSNLLEEIEKELDKDGRTGDTDDQIKAMLETLAKIRDIIGAPDTATDEDLEIAIQTLVDGAQPMEYDL